MSVHIIVKNKIRVSNIFAVMKSEMIFLLLLLLGQASALVLVPSTDYGDNLTYSSTVAGLHEFRLYEGMDDLPITLATFEYAGDYYVDMKLYSCIV